jgi:opacity protein-like surface antigen
MLVLVVVAITVLLSPSLVAAEPYGGLFAGAALSRDTDVDGTIVPEVTFKEVELNTSVVFGGKVGFFFEPAVLGGNFGLELEAYHFRPDIDTQTVSFSVPGFEGETTFRATDLHITAIALNGLYRLALAASADFPRGRLQPYLGVGLAAFIARLETRTTLLDANTDFGDTDVKPGAQVMAGAKFFITPHVALFGEYKFVHTAEFEFALISEPGRSGGFGTVEIAKRAFNLSTHMLQAGIAYHW